MNKTTEYLTCLQLFFAQILYIVHNIFPYVRIQLDWAGQYRHFIFISVVSNLQELSSLEDNFKERCWPSKTLTRRQLESVQPIIDNLQGVERGKIHSNCIPFFSSSTRLFFIFDKGLYTRDLDSVVRDQLSDSPRIRYIRKKVERDSSRRNRFRDKRQKSEEPQERKGE